MEGWGGRGRDDDEDICRRTKPVVKVEQTFTFNEKAIADLIVKYLQETYNISVQASDIKGDFRAPSYDHFYSSPGSCTFTVKVKV